MAGRLLIGGGFFTHEQLSFGRIVINQSLFNTWKISEQCLLKGIPPIDEDFVVIFGLKGLVRMLSKQGYRPSQIAWKIKQFFGLEIPASVPLVVVDDFSLSQSKYYFRPMLNFLSSKFNLKLYLLREYLRDKQYPTWVKPFSIPADSYALRRVGKSEKELDFFFHGNASSKERKKITSKLRKTYPDHNNHLVVTYGGIKNKSDRLLRNDFLDRMAQAKFCLSFSGSGYDCYRYHEIASVGSLIVTPDYPLVIRNDYTSMESCIKYRNFRGLKRQYETISSSRYMMGDLIGRSIDNFEQFHTSEKRADEFLEYIEEAIGL